MGTPFVTIRCLHQDGEFGPRTIFYKYAFNFRKSQYPLGPVVGDMAHACFLVSAMIGWNLLWLQVKQIETQWPLKYNSLKIIYWTSCTHIISFQGSLGNTCISIPELLSKRKEQQWAGNQEWSPLWPKVTIGCQTVEFGRKPPKSLERTTSIIKINWDPPRF